MLNQQQIIQQQQHIGAPNRYIPQMPQMSAAQEQAQY